MFVEKPLLCAIRQNEILRDFPTCKVYAIVRELEQMGIIQLINGYRLIHDEDVKLKEAKHV